MSLKNLTKSQMATAIEDIGSGCVVLYGAASSGKSTLANSLSFPVPKPKYEITSYSQLLLSVLDLFGLPGTRYGVLNRAAFLNDAERAIFDQYQDAVENYLKASSLGATVPQFRAKPTELAAENGNKLEVESPWDTFGQIWQTQAYANASDMTPEELDAIEPDFTVAATFEPTRGTLDEALNVLRDADMQTHILFTNQFLPMIEIFTSKLALVVLSYERREILPGTIPLTGFNVTTYLGIATVDQVVNDTIISSSNLIGDDAQILRFFSHAPVYRVSSLSASIARMYMLRTGNSIELTYRGGVIADLQHTVQILNKMAVSNGNIGVIELRDNSPTTGDNSALAADAMMAADMTSGTLRVREYGQLYTEGNPILVHKDKDESVDLSI